MKKTIVITALVLLALLSACSAGSSKDSMNLAMGSNTASAQKAATETTDTANYTASYDADAGFDTVYGESGTDSNMSDISLTDPNRKLIRTASVNVETTEFDDSVAKLEAMCLNYQGFVESSQISGASITARGKQYRSAYYSFRIPSIRYNEFLNSMGTIGNVINKSQNSQDVTDTYYDLESRLKILEMRRDRLMGLLEKETNSKSIVEFENSLSDTLYEIERLTGSLKKYDSLVEYSAISVSLGEVEKYTEIQPVTPAPKTVGERIASAFAESAENIGAFFVSLTVFVLGNVLYLLVWSAAIAAAAVILRKILKRGNKKQQNKGDDDNA